VPCRKGKSMCHVGKERACAMSEKSLLSGNNQTIPNHDHKIAISITVFLSVCVCMYLSVCVHAYIRIVCVCIFIYTYIHRHLYIHTCIYVRLRGFNTQVRQAAGPLLERERFLFHSVPVEELPPKPVSNHIMGHCCIHIQAYPCHD